MEFATDRISRVVLLGNLRVGVERGGGVTAKKLEVIATEQKVEAIKSSPPRISRVLPARTEAARRKLAEEKSEEKRRAAEELAAANRAYRSWI